MLVMVAIWWGAATSKLNRHFPFVVAAMESNSPIWRSKGIKQRFHRDFPEDLRPSRLSATLAHAGTVVEFGVPLLLLLGDGGPVTKVAAVVMLLFHLHILTSFPMGVPLEWNVFMMLGIVTLFVGHAELGVTDLVNPLPVVLLMLVVAGTVVLGNLFPDKVSFLPAMRYYAGNWDTSMWCFRGDALAKMDANTKKASLMPHQQLEKVYGDPQMVALHDAPRLRVPGLPHPRSRPLRPDRPRLRARARGLLRRRRRDGGRDGARLELRRRAPARRAARGGAPEALPRSSPARCGS